jgi:hypothetical protein
VAVFTRTITSAPEAIVELVVVFAVVACFVGLHAFLQRHLRSDVLRRHNDVAGYLFSAVGVLYAVVLGFVVVVVWQKYDATVSNIEAEVDAAADVYHSVAAFDPATRDAVRADLRKYAQLIVTDEWPAMARNADVPEGASEVMEDASHRIAMFPAQSLRESAAQQQALADAQRLFDARRERLIHSVPSVPTVLWFALVVGALAMVAFCYLFGVESQTTQLLMTAILVGLIAILFVVIGEFSTPFSGSVKISPDGWLYFQDRLHFIR